MAITDIYRLDFTTRQGRSFTLEMFQPSETLLSSPTVVTIPRAALPEESGMALEMAYENLSIGLPQAGTLEFEVLLHKISGSTALNELRAAILSPTIAIQPPAWKMPYSAIFAGMADEQYTIFASNVWTLRIGSREVFRGVQRFDPAPEITVTNHGEVRVKITLVDIRRYALESTPVGMVHFHTAFIEGLLGANRQRTQHMIYNHYYRKDNVTYASIFRHRAIDDAHRVFFTREGIRYGLEKATQDCYRYLMRNTTEIVELGSGMWDGQRLTSQPYTLTSGAQMGAGLTVLTDEQVFFQAYIQRNDSVAGWMTYEGMLYPASKTGWYKYKNAWDMLNGILNGTGVKASFAWVTGWKIEFKHPLHHTNPIVAIPANGWKGEELKIVLGGEILRGAEIGIDVGGDNTAQYRVETMGIGNEAIASVRCDMHSNPHIPSIDNVFYFTNLYDPYGLTSADLSGTRITTFIAENSVNMWVYFDQPAGALKELPIRCHTYGKYFNDPRNITETSVTVPTPALSEVQETKNVNGAPTTVWNYSRLYEKFYIPLRLSMLDTQLKNSMIQNYATILSQKFAFRTQYTVEGATMARFDIEQCGELVSTPTITPSLPDAYLNRHVILSVKHEVLNDETELKIFTVTENHEV